MMVLHLRETPIHQGNKGGAVLLWRKLKEDKGGLKELLYDNLAIFIVLVLIVVVGFGIARKTMELGTSVIDEQESLKTRIESSTP